MGKTFMEGAGCILKVKGKAGPAFEVEGWSDVVKALKQGLITIDSVDPTESDIAVPVVAADNFRVLYRFGQGFGNLRVSGTIYLGSTSGGGQAGALTKVKEAFAKLRLSASEKPHKVSITKGYSCMAYFVGLQLGGADGNFQRIQYTLIGIIAPNPDPKK